MSPGEASLPVSVIIVNFNGRHHLEICLPALYATSGVEFEVIVVDNGSNDGSTEWLREAWPAVRTVALPRNLGFGEGNRQGVEAAKGDYVAFLNSDTAVEPGWLAPLVDTLRREPQIAAVCSVLRLMEHPELVNARGGGMTRLGYGIDHDFLFPYEAPVESAPGGTLHDVLFPTAAAMLMRREEFLSLGGFDRSFFMYHEDVDLGWRLWLLGRRVAVAEDSVVRHRFLGTSKASKGLRWRAMLGLRHTIRSQIKHYEAWNLLLALRRHLLMLARETAFLHIGHALAWNLIHLPETLIERARIQRRRRVRDRDLFDRGLIVRQPRPLPPPDLPAAREAELAQLLPCDELEPPSPAAASRLGFGWYPAEPVGEVAARRTCGHARCFLRVGADESGRIELDAQFPGSVDARSTLTLRANGGQADSVLRGEGWQRVSLPARADGKGLVQVDVLSPTFVPHDLNGNYDCRPMGCAVRAVRFAPERPRIKRVYRSLSVVIPTHNRWPMLRETLEALAAQTLRGAQIVVVDDGSTDDTWPNLERFRDEYRGRLDLAVLHQENLKQGLARNHGLTAAKGDLVLFLGDDIVPDPGCLQAHLDRHNALGEGFAVVGFIDWYRNRIRVTPFLEFVNLDGAQFGFGLMRDGADAPFTNFYTSNVSIARDVVGDAPFDPAFASYGWEDIDLGWRLSRRGVRINYDRGASARHLHTTTLSSFWRRQIQVGGTIETLFQVRPELRGNPFLPAERPPKRWHLMRWLVPALLPAVAAVDRVGIPLPWKLYRELVTCGFYLGVQRGDAAR